jgi:hypothetical protein
VCAYADTLTVWALKANYAGLEGEVPTSPGRPATYSLVPRARMVSSLVGSV